MRRPFQFIAAAELYALLWIVTRWPAIHANVLFFDDFEIPFHSADFYIGPYRPTLYLEFLLRELIVPYSFWTVIPKLFGALYVGIAAATFIELLREWEVPPLIARLLPIIIVSHPLLADGALWQTYAGLPIVPALITAGAIAWSRGRRVLFTFLTLAGILGYQVYLTLAVVYAIAEPVIRRRFRWRETAARIAIIGACVIVQLTVTIVIRKTFGNPDPRGIVSHLDVKTQIHGAFDLLVNGWMPVIAYYAGALRAWSLWKYVPLALAAFTAIGTRRLIPPLFAASIFLIPALPNLALSAAPYSWRVSTPEAFALALALVPLLMAAPRAASIAIIAAVAVVMIPVSRYEAWCRTQSWERDQKFVASIPRDFTVVLAPINPNKIEDKKLIGPHDLTWGYDRRTPRMWSEFNDAWMAKRYVQHYANLRFLDCFTALLDARCTGASLACGTNRNDAPVEYPRAIQDPARKITIVCPSPARF